MMFVEWDNIFLMEKKMSTNYYHRTDICESCKRYKEQHIGKSSAGWEFSFQGYNAEEHRPAIMSFEDWKRELQADGKIFDEYGTEISVDDFIKLVEDKKGGTYNDKPNLNHYEYLSKQTVYDMSEEWKDPDGHSFTSSEFS